MPASNSKRLTAERLQLTWKTEAAFTMNAVRDWPNKSNRRKNAARNLGPLTK